MALTKFYESPEAKINTIQPRTGNVIFATDKNAIYYDTSNGVRRNLKNAIYKTTVSGGLRNIQVGDDLSGKTVYFDTTKDYNAIINLVGTVNVVTTGNSSFVTSSKGPPSLTVNGTIVFSATSTPNWIYSSLTLPSNIGTVTSVDSNLGSLIQIESVVETDVDCEYNYNEIQTVKTDVETLKETVNNSSGGGLYRHTISFGHSGPYAMDAITVYSSSSERVSTGALAFELLGTGWYATYMSSMHGEGMIIAKMTNSSTLSFKGAVSGTDTITAVYDTVKQV